MSSKVDKQFGAKQTSINMISQMVFFCTNILISFFLTPYILEHLSSEAYGFVGLSSNFISYASLVTTALNSMSSRFIAIAYYKNDNANVIKYYSSLLIANLVLSGLFLIPAIFIVVYLPNLVNIPDYLLSDVQALFLLVFTHFIVDLLATVWGKSLYIINRLDKLSNRQLESTILKGVLTFSLFAFLLPRLWYIGLIQLICSCYVFVRNLRFHKQLMPDIRIDTKHFDMGKIWELLSSGIWNTISSVGSILISGLDLLIVNLMVSALAMGVVSVAKQIPIYIQSLVVTLANIFAPKQTKLYAEQDYEGMKRTLIYSSKIVAIITAIPVVFMLIYSKFFFALWVPTEDSVLLWKIASVAVITYPISLVCSTFSAIISAANKVKVNSLVTIAFSLAGLGVMFVLLNIATTEVQKMLIVVSMSMGFMVLHNVLFLIPYCGKIIGCKTGGFYLVLLRSGINVVLSATICYGVSLVFKANGWITLIISGIIVCLVCIVLSMITILDKEDRSQVFGMVKKITNKIFKRG